MKTIKLTPYENSLIGRYMPGSEVSVLLDTSAADFTVVLPDAYSTQDTKFTFLNIGSNTATIIPIAGQYINDETTIVLSQYDNFAVKASEGKYYIVDRYIHIAHSYIPIIANPSPPPAGFGLIFLDASDGNQPKIITPNGSIDNIALGRPQ